MGTASLPDDVLAKSTLWDPMDYSLPGSAVPGILQARILEWVAMPSSRTRVESVQFSRSVVSDSL